MSKGDFPKVVAGLGLGVALGTAFGFYALAPNVVGGPAGLGASTQQELSQEKEARETAEKSNQTSDSVLASLSAGAVRNELKGRSVVLFLTPDANQRSVDATRSLIQKAGANVTGAIRLAPNALDAAKGDELKSIAANSLPAGAKLNEGNLSPGMHVGQLVSAALKTGDGKATESDRSVALGALEGGAFISFDGEPAGPADLAVIVGAAESNDYATSFLADFARGADDNFKGTVLAGSAPSAKPEGAIGKLRANRDFAEHVSTVDNIDSEAGRIAAVRALKEQAEKQAGHYGVASNARGAAPKVK